MTSNPLYDRAVQIVRHLQENGHTAYFAGGFVRDKLLGIPFGDIDIATDATPEDISTLFPQVHGVGESFGVMLVVQEGEAFEVATFREEGEYHDGRHPEEVSFSTPQKDALRRDFTINGMFWDPLQEKCYDFVDGERDLTLKIIRTIGNPHDRFSEDYLRMLRAIRFATRFNFDIEEATLEAIRTHACQITNISVERIFQEITKMITGPRPAEAVRLLESAGLLAYVLPEVAVMVGVEQPKEFHPEGDVFVHTCLVVENIGAYPSAVVAWAALLHDIGKPPTQTFDGRIRFNNHHHVGAQMTRDVLERLHASRAFIEDVVACVENHMHFIAVQEMRQSKLRRFLGRSTIEEELLLHKADCEASNGDISNYTFLREKQLEFAQEGVQPLPLILGRDLIDAGYTPSKEFGQIIQQVYDAQLEESVKTKEEALAWVVAHYPLV